MNDNDYSYCVGGFDRLDIDSPFEAPNSHFRASAFGYNVDESAYMIVAERNSLDLNLSDPGGSISCGYFGFPPESRSRVALCYHGLNREIKVVGSGLYKGLNF